MIHFNQFNITILISFNLWTTLSSSFPMTANEYAPEPQPPPGIFFNTDSFNPLEIVRHVHKIEPPMFPISLRKPEGPKLHRDNRLRQEEDKRSYNLHHPPQLIQQRIDIESARTIISPPLRNQHQTSNKNDKKHEKPLNDAKHYDHNKNIPHDLGRQQVTPRVEASEFGENLQKISQDNIYFIEENESTSTTEYPDYGTTFDDDLELRIAVSANVVATLLG